MRNQVVFLFAVIIVLSALGISRWHDFKEKELAAVLDAGNIEKIMYNTKTKREDGSPDFNRTISEPAAIKELNDFLAQYKVKKVSARNFTSEFPEEQFNFVIVYKDGRMSMPSLIERDIALADMNQYTILNGPIDYDWLEGFLASLEKIERGQ